MKPFVTLEKLFDTVNCPTFQLNATDEGRKVYESPQVTRPATAKRATADKTSCVIVDG
jgi:hypothetical protein